MKKHRKPYLQFNPHIRGLKSLESCEKLTQRGKIFYKSLRPESDPAEFLYKLKEPIKKDVKNYFSPARLETHQTSSVGRFKIISKSPSKETFPVKRREFSLQEQEEIDKLIDNKLNIELTSIKASIPQKIKKLSKNLIFSEELNTLRADSQAAVISKKVEQKLLPKLKKEAISEVLLKRTKKPPLDKNSLRNKLLERIKLLLLHKVQFSPKQKENSELDIDRICEKSKKAMEKYKILEILKS